MKIKNIVVLAGLSLAAAGLNAKSAQTLPNVTKFNTPCPANLFTTLKAASTYLQAQYALSHSWAVKIGSVLGGAIKDQQKDWDALAEFVKSGATVRNSNVVRIFKDELNAGGYQQFQNIDCISYQDAQGIIRWGTPQQFLQELVSYLESK